MIFWSTFNRHSSVDEHRGYSKYPFDECLYKETGRSLVQQILTEIFRFTIRSSTHNRYKSVDQLVSKLEILVKEISKDEYIKDSIIPSKDFL